VRVFIFILFLSLYTFANENNTKPLKLVCFVLQEEKVSQLCKSPLSRAVILHKETSLADKIAVMQSEICHEIEQENKIVLVAEGFAGTLVSIAQTNLLPYFRKRIHGIIVRDIPPNILKLCHSKNSNFQKTTYEDKVCQSIHSFYKTIPTQASDVETLIALSPTLQMDWYWPKTLLLGSDYKSSWIEALNEVSIEHLVRDEASIGTIKHYFSFEESKKVQPKTEESMPNYNGPLLRFHLNKILYQEKNQLKIERNISYGSQALQRYDMFFKETKRHKPLMLYVHGGGWKFGDKKSYEGLCKSYADRGFIAASINYRLMGDGNISMNDLISDIKLAIEDILSESKKYDANVSQVLVMGESAGAQLATVAMTKLSSAYQVSVAVLNSLPTDLRLFNEKKQIRLSGIKHKKDRLQWLDDFSPINQLDKYTIPTLITHSFSDTTILPKHLEDFEILSILHSNNIVPVWVEGGMHPITPLHKALQPGYQEIESKMNQFIMNHITIHQ